MASERGIPTITLWQPWASLIVHGHKTIETRSWPAPRSLVGRRIAIHAGKTKADVTVTGLDVWRPLLDDDSVRLRAEVRPLPLGAIVATARLLDCVPMVDLSSPDPGGPQLVMDLAGEMWLYDDVDTPRDVVTDQRPYGDFRPGRWAWLLDEITPTTEQCPACEGSGVLDLDGGGRCYDPDCTCQDCRVCAGRGRCDPIPAKGAQRVWYWQPEEADRAR